MRRSAGANPRPGHGATPARRISPTLRPATVTLASRQAEGGLRAADGQWPRGGDVVQRLTPQQKDHNGNGPPNSTEGTTETNPERHSAAPPPLAPLLVDIAALAVLLSRSVA